VTSALPTEALSPIQADPSKSAILLDIDGTLAPIVENAADACVPEPTRQLLAALSRAYGLVGCISGRRASDARAMVAIGAIPYVGSHGAELLRTGWTESELDPELQDWQTRITAFRREFQKPDEHRNLIRIEDKGPILAFHWRGSSDEQSAREAVDSIAEHATSRGFDVHWGRKVMEVRPPVNFGKGNGVQTLLDGRSWNAVLYAGDDITDLDAFHVLRKLHDEGEIPSVVCVGVRSDDGPPQIADEADLVVDGTDGMRDLLTVLADALS
jgi:trehalose 6-phosphate phosphatase